MNSLMKIGLFILAELLINRIINFIFRLIAKKKPFRLPALFQKCDQYISCHHCALQSGTAV